MELSNSTAKVLKSFNKPGDWLSEFHEMLINLLKKFSTTYFTGYKILLSQIPSNHDITQNTGERILY